ncbi:MULTISPECIES: hypothetical protein [Paenarthrobacter]|uniref:Uncharacterized protein n=1 Tax=Paenarthrobacter ureafaciens TaxID=37931 RepID=A0AAX3EGR6_PAEUR|nr:MULTISPECIES: hypothetical protein [Paenarthrobacter]MDO5865991.1 hypothetical protein [Paenarthrobacter sp. SD-2]MDO5877086.1 hypothetical protein [Paenarthrobacter sp. SD-1]UYV92288.1 hypothetical protein NL395_17465 [Paenarthrobacter ureafaciens]UYV96823.1 hypothetical protein NL394_17495 [Paenarthrobacter ureafaciens]WIV32187.1 hypothetical protein QN084_06140 [Paenarthrobacter sp. R1]
MSALNLPALNTTYTPTAIFDPMRQSLLNRIAPVPDAHLARRRVKRLAPALEEMIFGDVA